ncbi:hypothetical protein WJ438_09765 [Streptomyces sp. GD-15H]|uniref:hypothetical protein n=1 Tax=Streptomyces sp. GD-15H TaxID=3129112 RepID=UPI003245BEFD
MPPDQEARRAGIVRLLAEAAARDCATLLVSGDRLLLADVSRAGPSPEIVNDLAAWTDG